MPPPNICRTSALALELSSGCNMPFEVTGRTKKRKNRQEQQSRKTEDDQVAQAPPNLNALTSSPKRSV